MNPRTPPPPATIALGPLDEITCDRSRPTIRIGAHEIHLSAVLEAQANQIDQLRDVVEILDAQHRRYADQAEEQQR